MTSLPNQLPPGSYLHCLGLELEGGRHANLAFMWVLVTQTLVLLLPWQVLYQLSHIPSPMALRFLPLVFLLVAVVLVVGGWLFL